MQHKHTYDEHGLCFECDKPDPQSKASLMKQTRQRRRDAGLVEFRAWVTPEQKEKLREMLKQITR